MSIPALLALDDGSIYLGYSIGVTGFSVGEVVFNTSMTGYQEILMDPSYAYQMITFTNAHIGNVGVNSEDFESDKIWAAGLIVRNFNRVENHWRAEGDLSNLLRKHNIVGISGVDTRSITKKLVNDGSKMGCITTDVKNHNEAVNKAKNAEYISSVNLTQKVTCSKTYTWSKNNSGDKIVVIDFGVKYNILRKLDALGYCVIVVPAYTTLNEINALKPVGIVLSNGPGDPASVLDIIHNVREILASNIPVLGICFGFQLIALASGAKTYKMKFGHHGGNHPISAPGASQVLVSSQNHSFAVDDSSLNTEYKITYKSLFDGSLQGFAHTSKPIIGVQGHPESSPGPHEWGDIFQQFDNLMNK